MIKYEQTKIVLNSFVLDNIVILPNYSFTPYLPGLLPNKDYIINYSD
jgi:hypothetical protein